MGRTVTRSATAKLSTGESSSGHKAPTTGHKAPTRKVKKGRSKKAKGKQKMSKKNIQVNAAELEDSLLSLSLSLDDKGEDFSPEEKEEEEKSEGSQGSDTECSICLQDAVHPVKLPCDHIFCFLCIKGVVHSAVPVCALCRAPVPQGFVFNPTVVKEVKATEDEFTWYYEGRGGGWWEYDCRTSQELEEVHSAGVLELEMMIAGYIYIIDFTSMVQKRKSAQQIQRKIKRDKNVIDKIGVAGLKPTRPQR